MTTVLHAATWLSLALAAAAQEPVQKQKIEPPVIDPGPSVLVPQALAEQLKLDADQRTKVEELDKEFQQQRKAALTIIMLKIKTLMDKIERNEEPAPALAITTAVTSSMLDLKRTRATYEKKILAVLNDEQQRKFATWQKMKPKEKGKLRPVQRSEGSTPDARFCCLSQTSCLGRPFLLLG